MLEEYLSERQRKKRRRHRMLWAVTVAVFVFLLLLSVCWTIAESPIFRVNRFIVTGNQVVASSDVVTLLRASAARHRTFWSSILGINNMLTWPATLSTSDIASVPQVASIVLERNYGNHTLTAVVTERQPFAIWCEMPPTDASGNPSGNESCFWFDETGMLFAKAFDTAGNEIFAVHDSSQSGLGVNDKILPDVFVVHMISILQVLKASGLTIKDIALNNLALQEVDVATYNGPTIYFSLRFNATEDMPVLQGFMAKPNFDTLQYIDFRTENRAYYQ